MTVIDRFCKCCIDCTRACSSAICLVTFLKRFYYIKIDFTIWQLFNNDLQLQIPFKMTWLHLDMVTSKQLYILFYKKSDCNLNILSCELFCEHETDVKLAGSSPGLTRRVDGKISYLLSTKRILLNRSLKCKAMYNWFNLRICCITLARSNFKITHGNKLKEDWHSLLVQLYEETWHDN